ncbi:MAG: O-antigen ligase family protein [Gammaproteobacteria bacterium]|nr:O-antigen ligase family protein [Gammaproteobacteria bacterium]MBU1655983.1 O-antigen ligase family protein [Gammaproteobacteria bacterium]MBU1962567.1 O-antigen ligase family protein [Gammaproteobacteria bacterium]
MPEHLRALVFILILAAMVFMMAARSACSIVERAEFERQRSLWFILTLIAFLSHNFWVYVCIGGLLIHFAARQEPNRLALFFFLLFLIPSAPAEIPGFGVINYVFTLTHIRLLELIILLPAYLALRRQSDTLPFGHVWADRLLLMYLLLTFVLLFREPDSSLTNVMRGGFYLFIDIFLPYYVASRALRDLHEFKQAMLSFVLAAMVLAIIGLFEFTKHWLLYGALVTSMGLEWDLMGYLGRAGLVRANATTGQAIALGYTMAVAIGFFLFLMDFIRIKGSNLVAGELVAAEVHCKMCHISGGLLLAGGLIAPLSRGPWLGAVALIAVFIATGPGAFRRLAILGLTGLLLLPTLEFIPGGEKVISLLPFVGTVEKENVDYREKLLQNALIVIERHPWLGSPDALKEPEMEALRQGSGIIDLVNSYIGIALDSGLVGLSLFLGFFVFVVLGVLGAFRHLPENGEGLRRLGRSLFATLIGILLIIFTVSSISVIPVIYWSVAGLGVAYARMVELELR